VDHTVLYALERMLDCQASRCVVSDATMDRFLKHTQTLRESTSQLFERMTDPVEMERIATSYVTRLRAEGVRVARCGHHVWLRLKSSRRTTDPLFTSSACANDQTIAGFLSPDRRHNASQIAG
jgi:hypothetical protein